MSLAARIDANADASQAYRWMARTLFVAATMAWPWATVPRATAWAATPQSAAAIGVIWCVWVGVTAWGCPGAHRRGHLATVVWLMGQAVLLGHAVGLTLVTYAGANGGLLLYVLAAAYATLSFIMAVRGGDDPPHIHALALALVGSAIAWLAYRWFPLRPSMVAALLCAIAIAAVRLAWGRRAPRRLATTLIAGLAQRDTAAPVREALTVCCGCRMLHAEPQPLPDRPEAGASQQAQAGGRQRYGMVRRHVMLCVGLAVACYAAGHAMRAWDGDMSTRMVTPLHTAAHPVPQPAP